MNIPKSELCDFSRFPAIQRGLREYLCYGAIIDFEGFVDEVDKIVRELERIEGLIHEGSGAGIPSLD